MKNVYLFVWIFLLFHTHSNAQQNKRRSSLSGGLQVAQPLGEFAGNYSGNPVGFSGQFVGPLGRSPFDVGISASWNNMAQQQEKVPVFMGTDSEGDDVYEEGIMYAKGNNYRYMMLARFRPFAGAFQIYVDALAGVETFSMKTETKVDHDSYKETIDKAKRHSDIGFNAGWAAGVKVRLADSFFVEGRFEKLEGSKVSFVDPTSIEISNNGDLYFQTIESATNKYTIQLGISIEF